MRRAIIAGTAAAVLTFGSAAGVAAAERPVAQAEEDGGGDNTGLWGLAGLAGLLGLAGLGGRSRDRGERYGRGGTGSATA